MCVWFRPPHPPIRTDRTPRVRKIQVGCVGRISRIEKGAIFCQVDRIRPIRNGSPCKTSGSHLWQGAMAIFREMAAIKRIVVSGRKGVFVAHELNCVA